MTGEYKGKCFRHGVLFKSGMGFDSCPACYFEGELGKFRRQVEIQSAKNICVVAIAGVQRQGGVVFTLEALKELAANNKNMWMDGDKLMQEI